MVEKIDGVRLTSQQLARLRTLPDSKLQLAFLLLGRVSPEALDAGIRRAEEDHELKRHGDPISQVEFSQLNIKSGIRESNDIYLNKSQITALRGLPTGHLRKALRLMTSAKQEDIQGLILHAQNGVLLERDELRRLMADTATFDGARHTMQNPAQQDTDDSEG